MHHLTRSLLAVPAVLLGLGSLAAADTGPTWVETVVADTTTPVELTLDSHTVLCSSADYGQLFLKVLIPDLARLTLLDHQNLGAGAPCVASGQCRTGNMPSDVIDPAHPTDQVQVNVQEVRLDEADPTAQTCTTTLIERVHVTIRGIEFFHEREAPLGTRAYGDCATSEATASGSGSDSKADGPGTSAPANSGGGCSTTGNGSGAALIAAALLAVRRRRRA